VQETSSVGGGRGHTRTVVVAAILVIGLVAILALGEMRLRTCIQRAEARYPAVPVSAFTGQDTGPVKVSYVRERADAVDECGRL
jgi:hypothetical protein